jgi:hypothetical protein
MRGCAVPLSEAQFASGDPWFSVPQVFRPAAVIRRNHSRGEAVWYLIAGRFAACPVAEQLIGSGQIVHGRLRWCRPGGRRVEHLDGLNVPLFRPPLGEDAAAAHDFGLVAGWAVFRRHDAWGPGLGRWTVLVHPLPTTMRARPTMHPAAAA